MRALKKRSRMILPESIELLAIHESWKIHYEHIAQDRFTTKKIAPYEISIRGKINNNPQKCIEVLQNWLKKKAKRHLKQWLHAISFDTDLSFKDVTIRGQKTRWGSCSSDKMINLNYKLLFLPAPLVENVLVHELCHTKQLNHSARFWKLVEKFDSNYKQHNKLLLKTEQYVPKWTHY